jgi:hypothetical protein
MIKIAIAVGCHHQCHHPCCCTPISPVDRRWLKRQLHCQTLAQKLFLCSPPPPLSPTAHFALLLSSLSMKCPPPSIIALLTNLDTTCLCPSSWSLPVTFLLAVPVAMITIAVTVGHHCRHYHPCHCTPISTVDGRWLKRQLCCWTQAQKMISWLPPPPLSPTAHSKLLSSSLSMMCPLPSFITQMTLSTVRVNAISLFPKMCFAGSMPDWLSNSELRALLSCYLPTSSSPCDHNPCQRPP